MSNLINKVKDTLSSNKDKHNDHRSDNYGPHSSNVANTADPRVDSNPGGVHHNQTYGSGPAGTTGTYGAPGGGYGDNTVGGGQYGAPGGGYGSTTTAGPHSSNLANKADPRVDSDLDGGRNLGHGQQGGYGSSTAGGYGSNQAYGTQGSTNAGPHNSNVANKLDPRVDSDRDHRNDPSSTYGNPTSGGAYTGSTATGSTNAGPQLTFSDRNDPTSRVGGYGGQENYGVAGSNPAPSSGGNYGNTGYAEPHQGHHGHPGHQGHQGAGVGAGSGYGQSGYDNRATGQTGYSEPGYGATGAGQYGSSATPGSGNTSGTAGPHNSNLLNKLDPRVDSDLDGSKTYGGNQTHR